jgi:hypothetical protein
MALHPPVLAASQLSAAEAQIAEAVKWLAEDQKGRGAALLPRLHLRLVLG